MESFLDKFKIGARPESLGDLFEAAKRAYGKYGNQILEFEKYKVFTHRKDDISRIRDLIAEDSDNLLYCYFLNEAIKANDTAAIDALSKPRVEDKSEVYDSLSLFALMWELPKVIAHYRRRKVPADVIEATAEMFQNQVGDYILLHGRYGLCTYVRWMMRFIRAEIIRVGRFNLEMCKYCSPFDIFERDGELVALANGAVIHKSGRILGSADCEDEDGSFAANITESDEYFEGYQSLGSTVSLTPVRLPKSEWRRALTAGEKIVSVHIPTGGPLTPEVCDADLRRGQEIIENCLTDFKMFYCSSWLLDTELKAITGKEGNVTRFGDRYTRFPIKSTGGDVFTYVFDRAATTPPAELPEKNSFATAIKKHLVAGGRVYGAAGVFEKFDIAQRLPDALIPAPLQIVVDDVGWFNGKDDRAEGGPSRTGIGRRHVAEDLRALNRLGKEIGMKIVCAFIVGEWDPDNRLRDVPCLSKYGAEWDNASHLDREEMARYVEAINESPYIELTVHGLLHGYYREDVLGHDNSDYYYYNKDKELVMISPEEIRHRIFRFRDILAYYGINKKTDSFVPPSFKYRWNEISHVLKDLGIKYVSTVFAGMECEGERPVIAGVENGIVNIDRNLNMYPWDELNSSFDDVPFKPGVFGIHWPNLLHPDPARNDEVIDRAIAQFNRSRDVYGMILSRGIEFSAAQSLYHRFSVVSVCDGYMRIDVTALENTPVAEEKFVISARGEITSVEGGEIVGREDRDGFVNYEIKPTHNLINIKL